MKCPKCGSRMTQGAPHVQGGAQWECHHCGYIKIVPWGESTKTLLRRITTETQDRYTVALTKAGIASVSHAFRLLNAVEQGLRRFVAIVHYESGDEQIDVDAVNSQQALDIARKAVTALYQSGSTGIDIEGPINADTYHM